MTMTAGRCDRDRGKKARAYRVDGPTLLVMNMRRGPGRAERRQARLAGRVLRGLRPDRNPLRRTVDRVEAYLLGGLFVASVAAAPFAAQAASHAAYTGALHAQHAQLATRHLVPAELTRPASAGSADELGSYVPVRATWTSVTGVRHAGQVMVPAGSRVGRTVTVWTDAAGNLVTPPLLASQVAGQGDMAAIGAVAGLGALYLCEVAIVRRAVNRRRMAAWDADWVVTARAWNRQRW